MGLRISILVSLLIHAILVFSFVSLKPEGSFKTRDVVKINLSRVVLEKETEVHREPKVVKKIKRAKPKRRDRKPVFKPKPKRVKKTPVKEAPEKPQPAPVVEKRAVQEEIKAEDVVKATTPAPEEIAKPVEEYEYVSSYPVGLGEEEDEEEIEETTGYQEEYIEENLSLIREVVAGFLKYPPVARRMGWEGTVVVSFYLTPEGVVKEEKIEKSSGYELLDRNALRVIRLASREFPRPEREVVVVLPIVYRLE